MSELGEFLRSRRARVQPEDLGLPVVGRRRRVPGLRREEVAQLAGVSVDYYVRLEQGRGQGASEAVLDAVAGVLRLDATERAHLYDLARPPRTPVRAQAQSVRPGVRRMLDLFDGPSFVIGRSMDVLAWNALADAVIGLSALPPEQRNMARHAFLSPAGRALYLEWRPVATATVAYLRLSAARYPGDRALAALVAELGEGSEVFRELWQEHGVREKSYGRKVLGHPQVGRLEVDFETLELPGDPDQLLVVYTAEPGSVTAGRLAALVPVAV
ncbi:helix-turn-helix transcriptional regulator [Kitasatospora paracochleata]|uniref:Transcriptional regulator with XRE-family HTH domain n=1 Tax=Kitasatospora paracochleata TaxID=58354 RepID=A0ABT1J669_9ACTN|nr:helix-turn-helix transcriptional regulator [Kitasatospora paracochleata]MCP2312932.1 transcriptional regulator with XRE-family HTH domain [Kitasatospora paracochleata]